MTTSCTLWRRTPVLGVLTLGVWLAGPALSLGQERLTPVTDNAMFGVRAKARAQHDDLPHPKAEERRQERKQGFEAKVKAARAGQRTGKVHRVANGQYVELEREGEDLIFTVLGEFGSTGPRHNQIPEPDRAVDNSTIWVPDFSRAHYQQLLFADAPGANSMRNYYKEVSSNRYAVSGLVTDWVPTVYNGPTYDDDITYGCPVGGSAAVCPVTGVPASYAFNAVWLFLSHSLNAWYPRQLDAGLTPEQIDELLAPYDVWDRYDYDNDGDFNEPDGYIDHFQAVHAGMGEEVGGGALGSAAIWSHRWFASYNLAGLAGPSFNRQGGVRVGNSRYWVGDYTIEPENGGVGVFAHEFAHDLDIPDLYDTTGAADNSVGFWSLMASGSYGSDGTVDIGSKPTHMGAWEKLMLGWLDYEVAVAGRKSEHKLGPSTTTTKQAQAIVVVLPDLQVGPFEGSRFFYSGSGPNLNTMMLKSVTLPVGATLAAKVRYDIEQNWDYAYLVVYDGATYHRISTNRSTTTNPNGQNAGNGITGSTDFEWVDLTADLSAFGGQTVQVGFLYRTDAFVNGLGFSVDALAISGQPVDGAESGTGWAFTPDGNGFRIVTGSLGDFFNAYIAELRQYRGYDESLETGPYVFGFLNDPSLQDYVAHFPYQTGLLVSYYDSRYSDNNVSAHPGRGLILPIDAHPEPLLLSPTTVWAARYQSYDSPFGLQRTDPITLYRNGAAYSYSSLPAVPIFDDREPRWDPAVRFAGVRTPATGTRIRVKSISAQGSFMQVEVAPAK